MGTTAQRVGRSIYVRQPPALLSDGTAPDVITRYEFNSFGLLITEIDPLGFEDEYRYGPTNDPNGAAASTTSGGYLAEVEHDVVTLQITTKQERDPVGNVVARIDGRGIKHQYVINERNQVQVKTRASDTSALNAGEPISPL